MNLDFSEEQIMLRESAARLCDNYHNSHSLRQLEKDDIGYSQHFWQGIASLGLCGLAVSEARDGVGLGAIETVVVHEEMGRTLAPSPHLDCCVISTSLLAEAASESQQAQWLTAIANGEKIIIPAWQEAQAGADVTHLASQLTQHGDQWLLSGEKVLVPFANSADAFIVAARDQDQRLQLLLMPAEAASLRRQANHADQNLYAITFDQVEVSPLNRLNIDSNSNNDAASCWDRAMLKGLIAAAAQAVGGASRILTMANQYAKERQQFGKPLGAFQSIAHYLADRATEIEGARYLTYQAAWACDSGEEWEQLALMAKLQATAVFRRSAVDGVQIHGGMGFSAEAAPQLYYRRAKHLQLMHWDPGYIEQRVAQKVFG